MRDIFYERLDLPVRISANEFSNEDLRTAEKTDGGGQKS